MQYLLRSRLLRRTTRLRRWARCRRVKLALQTDATSVRRSASTRGVWRMARGMWCV